VALSEAESGGENAKFGLSTSELLAAAELLRAENLSSSFKLLHFHIGSQVPDILTVKKAVQEAAERAGLGTSLPDPVARAIVAAGGRRVGLLDLDEATRQAVFDALAAQHADVRFIKVDIDTEALAATVSAARVSAVVRFTPSATVW
jgi:diaminopimelate decarboxylase